jgi:hypothetical protein
MTDLLIISGDMRNDKAFPQGHGGIVLRVKMGQDVFLLGQDLLLLQLDASQELTEQIQLLMQIR